MLAGNREDILSVGLENGKSVDEFVALFTEKVKDISTDDEVILLGDISVVHHLQMPQMF